MNKLIGIIWKQFSQRKLRSALTILGIVIGISALISLILLTGALKQGITGQLDRFGSDTILAAPKAGLANSNSGPSGVGKFTQKDVDIVRSIPGVLEVQPLVRITGEIKLGREKIRSEVRGTEIDEKFVEFLNLDIASGRYLESADRKSVNIGYKIATDAFDKEIFVGNSIQINGDKYTVVGIFQEEGDSNNDNIIITSIDDVREIVGQSDAVTAMSIKIVPGQDLKFVEQRIIETLKKYRGEEDFSTITPEQLKDQIGQLLGVVNIVVYSIALVSLFVASLGIMNSLYTSVLQRTREIGTMKAVGAKNSQIFFIYVSESAILGFIGGVLGIIAGIIIAYVFTIPLNAFGIFKFTLVIQWQLLLGSLLFSIVLGIASGALPAYRAAKLKVVDALRYE